MALVRWHRLRRKRRARAGLVLFALLLLTAPAGAQDEALDLRLRRSFGYSWGGEIQGSFLLIAEGPPDLRTVSFYVDQALLETVSAPPFQARLHTGDYPMGPHELWAEGTLSDGSTARSNVIEADFVAASASWQAVLRMLAPVLVLVGLALAAGIGITAISSRRYRPGEYGASGGAICPRCDLPIARHFLAPTLGGGKKLERCPHCGAWSRVARASPETLAQAEARLLSDAGPEAVDGQQDAALRRQVDDSRFVD